MRYTKIKVKNLQETKLTISRKWGQLQVMDTSPKYQSHCSLPDTAPSSVHHRCRAVELLHELHHDLLLKYKDLDSYVFKFDKWFLKKILKQ